MSTTKLARQHKHAPTLKSCTEWGERKKGEENKGRGEKTQRPDYAPWGVQCGAGKKPRQHQGPQTLAHHPT